MASKQGDAVGTYLDTYLGFTLYYDGDSRMVGDSGWEAGY